VSERAIFVVDRLEGKVAVVVGDDGRTLNVERRALPAAARREGAVLRVAIGDADAPVWATAEVDHEEEQRRQADARRRLDRLKKSDPGGDISL